VRFSAYPEYKDSAIDWLGEIPEHWGVVAIKWISPVLRGASPRPIDDPIYFDEEGEYGWVRISDVTASTEGYLYKTTQKLSELGASLSVKLEQNQLFLSIAGSVGKPCITKIRACIHDGFVYFPSLSIDPRMLFRIFEAGICFGGLGKFGTQLNLNTDTVGGIHIPIPAIPELPKILEFLDYETARIDALIEEQQRLIELLKEKRQAVISHAVTKGLDPNVPMKDSGVEWLDEVPECWELKSLKYIATVFGRIGFRGYTTDDIVDEGNGAITVSPSNMIGGLMDFNNVTYISWGKYEESPEIKLAEDDVLIVKTGSTYGRVAYVNFLPEHATINPQLAIFKKIQIENKFLYYLFESSYLKAATRNSNTGGTMPTMTQEAIGNYKLPLPPLNIQRQIVEKLESELRAISNLIELAVDTVDLEKERRSALISAAVTGKIDVRNWKPPADKEKKSTQKETAHG
jgi:type I restriction enzyme S subunit